MTASQNDLITLFADGEMPTGAHFSALITSMTPRTEFDAHTEAFKEWAAAGTVHLGPPGIGWSLLSPDAQTLNFVPDEPDPIPGANAMIDLYGWTSSFGRFGTGENPGRFTGAPLLDRAKMAEVDCGEWVKILEPPSGLAAFEIVAATQQHNVTQYNLFMRILRRVIGLQPDQPEICHAIVTARAPGVKPNIQRSEQNRIKGLLWRSLLELLALNFICFPIYISAMGGASQSQQNVAGFSILILLAGWTLRRVIQIVTMNKRSIRLRWKKGQGDPAYGTNTYALQVHGPLPANDPKAKLHYHITALWG